MQTTRLFYAHLNGELYRRNRRVLRLGLEWAAQNGKEACVKRILHSTRRVSLNTTRSLLWISFLLAITDGHTDVVRLLLEHRIDPNPAQDSDEKLEKPDWLGVCFGSSPQHPAAVAAKHGHEPVRRLLVAYGAKLEAPMNGVNSVAKKIEMPLQEAVKRKDVSLIKFLLNHGCRPHPCAHCAGHNPLFDAADLDLEIVQMFFEAGADPLFQASV